MNTKLSALLVALMVSLAPVQAQDSHFTDLCNRRVQLVEKVSNGTATPADVAELQSVNTEIHNLFTGRAKEQANRMNAIMSEMSNQQNLADQVYNSLFTGKNPPVNSGNSNINVTQPQPHLQPRTSQPDNVEIHPPRVIPGEISFMDSIGPEVNKMVNNALLKNPEALKAMAAVSHYDTPLQHLLANGKDALNYLIPYRGFAPSNEAVDVILDHDVKVKSLAAALYARQKVVDSTHTQLMINIMQTAMGIGSNQQDAIDSGVKGLTDLVGAESATKIQNSLTTWKTAQAEPVQPVMWDVLEKQRRYQLLMENASRQDQVILQIMAAVNKYHHGKAGMATSHVLNTILGAASMTPTFAGPAARGVLTSYVMMTGGPEDCKLLKELYLDKRLESRMRLISEESHLALDNYQLASATNNQVLLNCAQDMIQRMVPQEIADKVLE